jgi:hypothetical protein
MCELNYWIIKILKHYDICVNICVEILLIVWRCVVILLGDQSFLLLLSFIDVEDWPVCYGLYVYTWWSSVGCYPLIFSYDVLFFIIVAFVLSSSSFILRVFVCFLSCVWCGRRCYCSDLPYFCSLDSLSILNRASCSRVREVVSYLAVVLAVHVSM